MDNIKKCGICGKELGDGVRSLLGLSISVKISDPSSRWSDLAKQQFGKFDPSREYLMCFECWLSKLGFKP